MRWTYILTFVSVFLLAHQAWPRPAGIVQSPPAPLTKPFESPTIPKTPFQFEVEPFSKPFGLTPEVAAGTAEAGAVTQKWSELGPLGIFLGVLIDGLLIPPKPKYVPEVDGAVKRVVPSKGMLKVGDPITFEDIWEREREIARFTRPEPDVRNQRFSNSLSPEPENPTQLLQKLGITHEGGQEIWNGRKKVVGYRLEPETYG